LNAENPSLGYFFDLSAAVIQKIVFGIASESIIINLCLVYCRTCWRGLRAH
jgi:hypothetical protein